MPNVNQERVTRPSRRRPSLLGLKCAFLSALILTGAIAVASGKSPRASAVEAVVVTKSELASTCRIVTTLKGHARENYRDLRIQAAAEGANYLVLDIVESRTWGASVIARALVCPADFRPECSDARKQCA
jgi:hypothetical protein